MWDSWECLRQSTRALTGYGWNSEFICHNRPNALTGRSVLCRRLVRVPVVGAFPTCRPRMKRWSMPIDLSTWPIELVSALFMLHVPGREWGGQIWYKHFIPNRNP
ncbi:unnamed protein product [Prunus armeniaca]